MQSRLPTLPAKTSFVRCHDQTVPCMLLSAHKHACTSAHRVHYI